MPAAGANSSERSVAPAGKQTTDSRRKRLNQAGGQWNPRCQAEPDGRQHQEDFRPSEWNVAWPLTDPPNDPQAERRQYQHRERQLPIRFAPAEDKRRNQDSQTKTRLDGPPKS